MITYRVFMLIAVRHEKVPERPGQGQGSKSGGNAASSNGVYVDGHSERKPDAVVRVCVLRPTVTEVLVTGYCINPRQADHLKEGMRLVFRGLPSRIPAHLKRVSGKSQAQETPLLWQAMESLCFFRHAIRSSFATQAKLVRPLENCL